MDWIHEGFHGLAKKVVHGPGSMFCVRPHLCAYNSTQNYDQTADKAKNKGLTAKKAC